MKEYVKGAEIVLVANKGRLNAQNFNDEAIVKEAEIFHRTFDNNQPGYIDCFVQKNILDDETSLL